MEISLDQLALFVETDKASNSHYYTQYYEQLFNNNREDVKAILELGIGSGQSLQLWEFFFPNALIYGLDQNGIDDKFGDRVICYHFNQKEKEKLIETFKDKNLEIIIDDASHAEEETLISLDALFPLLVSNGYYIIEDMNEKIPTKILDWMYKNRTTIQSLSILPDKGTLEGNNYEYLIAIQKNSYN